MIDHSISTGLKLHALHTVLGDLQTFGSQRISGS